MARVRVPLPPDNLRVTDRASLRGLREYAERLAALGNGLVERGCVIALAMGGNVLRDAVRVRTPVLARPDPRRKPFTLRNAVQVLRSKRTRYAVTYVIGVRQLTSRQVKAYTRRTGRASSANPDDPFYGAILEYGKTARTQRPFIRPGFAAGASSAVSVSTERLRRYAEAELARLAVKP